MGDASSPPREDVRRQVATELFPVVRWLHTVGMVLALGVAVVTEAGFGPTAPWRTGPYGKGNVTVRAGLDCSPCFRRTCENAVRCMEAVTVEDVMSRIPVF